MANYYPPRPDSEAYNCAHCGVYAKQIALRYGHYTGGVNIDQDLIVQQCVHCHQKTYWLHSIQVYPETSGAPMTHPAMPDEVSKDYLEARSILGRSPRGAAALLRLAVQKLCALLGKSGKNINQDIAELVKDGLPVEVQQALDTLRVVGNESVHPGKLDVRDDRAVAAALFDLVNFIVEDRIARPAKIRALYESLPEDKLAAIKQRDSAHRS